MQGYRDEPLDVEMNDFLEDSLSYSPLRDVTNKENSPALFFNNIERARKSPSTARLFALLGGGPPKIEPCASPIDTRLTPRRLQDFLETPDKKPIGHGSPLEQPKSTSELSSEVEALRNSLIMIQKDCEFHRQRAVAAQDQVDHLNKYISLLEEENRKVGRRPLEVSSLARPGDDAEKLQLRFSVESMEALNKSLSRQNDLLRRRSSVTARFSFKDAKIQTDVTDTVSVGTDPLVADINDLQSLPFLATPSVGALTPASVHRHLPFATPGSNIKVSRIYVRDSECQTETGIWATVEDITSASSTFVTLPTFVPSVTEPGLSLPIPKRMGCPMNTAMRARRSLPSSYPMSPFSNPIGAMTSKALVPKPLLAPSRRVKTIQESSSVFHSRKEWKQGAARRGKSTGAVSRPKPRWIP